MSKKSTKHIDSRVVFHQSFNSFQDIKDNGGVISGTPTISDGVCTFNGSNSFFAYKKSFINNTNYSIRFRVKAPPQIDNPILYSETDIVSSANPAYLINVQTAAPYNKLRIYIRTLAGAVLVDSTTTQVVYDNTWHDVVITDANGMLKVYVDGVISSINLTYTRQYLAVNSTQLGRGMLGAGVYSRYFNGSIDGFTIYNKALTATEVSCLYNNSLYVPSIRPTIFNMDLSENVLADKLGHTITNTNCTLRRNGNSSIIDYNGTTSVTTVTNTADLSFTSGGGVDLPLTVEVWVKLVNISTTQMIFAKGLVSEWVLMYTAANKFRLNLYSSASVYCGRQTDANISFRDKWVHFSATYDGSKITSGIKVYLNGVQSDTSNDNSGTYIGMVSSTTTPTIMNCTASYWTKGSIGAARLYNRVLTAEELVRNYYSEKGKYGL